LKAFIQRLTLSTEIAIVVLVAFGLFCAISIVTVLSPVSGDLLAMTNADLIALIVYEAVTLVAFAIFLYLRGWTASAIGLAPSFRQSISGIGIAAAVLAVFAGVSALIPGAEAPEAAEGAAAIASSLTVPGVLALSVINAVYEEVLVCGYLVSAITERRNASIAIIASAVLRAVYHLYQGPVAAVLIGVMGLGFALYYVRSGKLWPLIVGHGILDVVALYPSVSS
jgi:uncharacterized protein